MVERVPSNGQDCVDTSADMRTFSRTGPTTYKQGSREA